MGIFRAYCFRDYRVLANRKIKLPPGVRHGLTFPVLFFMGGCMYNNVHIVQVFLQQSKENPSAKLIDF